MKNNLSKLDSSKICVGIDLGTTNTTVAYMAPEQSGPVDCKIRQKGHGTTRTDEILPSVLYRKADGSEVVGNEAEDLKENSFLNSQEDVRYLENTKRYMGTRSTFTIDDRVYTPIDVATAILEHVKKYSIINRIKGDYYTIITVPAKFGNDQRSATLEAARRAGFENVELYDEPKAAILSFLHADSLRLDNKLLDLSSKKRILVIDIGGGTCDICVEDVEKQGDQYIFSHKAVGREDLGGVDFDTRIGDELAKKYLQGATLSASEVASLRSTGQKIKERISQDIDYFICDEYDGDESELYKKADWHDILDDEGIECSLAKEINGKSVTFSMGAREFCNVIDPLIYQLTEDVAVNKDERRHNKNMESLINETLNESDINVDSIDIIFLTGGMAKCFPLRAALYELYKKPIISPEDPFYAVSRGASLVNRYKTIDESSPDIMPNAIMMDMDNGRLETLVEIGEQVPVQRTVDRVFETVSRMGVVIRLFEGKNEFDSQLRRINNLYIIKFDEPQPIGRAFKIDYAVDRTKRIKFTITFLDNDDKYEISGQIREDNE